MRVALLSDIHGNSIALDAVLADLERRGGADHHWVLGDLVALGHDPIGVLERITALPRRADHAAATPTATSSPASGRRRRSTRRPAIRELVPVVAEVAAIVRLDRGCRDRGRLDAVAGRRCPTEVRMTLPDGTRLLGVHADRPAATTDRASTRSTPTTSSPRGWPAATPTSCSPATRIGRSTARSARSAR